MRGYSKADRMLKASELNHFFVGSPFTVDMPDGGELCGEIAAINWSQSGSVRVFLTVPAGPNGDAFIDLERSADIMVPLKDEA